MDEDGEHCKEPAHMAFMTLLEMHCGILREQCSEGVERGPISVHDMLGITVFTFLDTKRSHTISGEAALEQTRTINQLSD